MPIVFIDPTAKCFNASTFFNELWSHSQSTRLCLSGLIPSPLLQCLIYHMSSPKGLWSHSQFTCLCLSCLIPSPLLQCLIYHISSPKGLWSHSQFTCLFLSCLLSSPLFQCLMQHNISSPKGLVVSSHSQPSHQVLRMALCVYCNARIMH